MLLIVINGIAIFYFFQKGNAITTFVFGLLLIFQFFLCIEFIKLQFQVIEKSIDCLLYDDYSVTLKEAKNKTSLHNKTAKLIAKHKKRHWQISNYQKNQKIHKSSSLIKKS